MYLGRRGEGVDLLLVQLELGFLGLLLGGEVLGGGVDLGLNYYFII